MFKRIPSLALLVAAAALLAVPAIGQANHKSSHNPGSKAQRGKSCAKKPTVNKGFVVRGTLKSVPTANSIEITVTGANRHARLSGELDDQSNAPGVQVAGDTYTLNPADADDPFNVRLADYTAPDTPSIGDAVRIVGKVPVTRKKCAPGDTVAERYGDDVDIRRVKIADRDADV